MRDMLIKLIGTIIVMGVLFVPIFLTHEYGMLAGWLSMIALTFTSYFLLNEK